MTRTCKKCRGTFPLTLEFFPRHARNAAGLDIRCRKCKAEGERLVARLKKTAPTKPHRCDLCEKIPPDGNLHLDHDPIREKFRGWLCKECNMGLGFFGDNLLGTFRAVVYLGRYEITRITGKLLTTWKRFCRLKE